jgi:hypothetical protein
MKFTYVCSLFLFLLISCCNQDGQESWCIDKVCNRCPKYQFSKMTLECISPPGVEAELTYGCEGLNFFLNFLNSPLIISQNDRSITAEIQTESFSYEDQAYLLEGNQRLVFTQKGAEIIVQGLLADEQISIKIGMIVIEFPIVEFTQDFIRLIT